MTLSRRGFIGGMTALIAAPAVVRAASLMPVRGIVMDLYGRSPIMDALPDMRALQAEFIERMSQQVVHTILYGNPEWSPQQFTGFVPAWSKE